MSHILDESIDFIIANESIPITDRYWCLGTCIIALVILHHLDQQNRCVIHCKMCVMLYDALDVKRILNDSLV